MIFEEKRKKQNSLCVFSERSLRWRQFAVQQSRRCAEPCSQPSTSSPTPCRPVSPVSRPNSSGGLPRPTHRIHVSRDSLKECYAFQIQCTDLRERHHDSGENRSCARLTERCPRYGPTDLFAEVIVEAATIICVRTPFIPFSDSPALPLSWM